MSEPIEKLLDVRDLLRHGDRDEDGYGQSLFVDLRNAMRFRKLARRSLTWRKSTETERAAMRADHGIGRFADNLVALTEIDGMAAAILDRDWFGWPDPPQFALFVIADGGLWLAKDFAAWPPAWTVVGDDGLEPPTSSV